MIRVEIASMRPKSVARFPKCLQRQTFGHHWLLEIVVDKRNHVHVTKVCKESCNTGAKGYWHFYDGANTRVIAQLLSRELSVNLKLWMENDWCCEGCTFFHCPELGMRIRFTKTPMWTAWCLAVCPTEVQCQAQQLHSQNNCSIFQDLMSPEKFPEEHLWFIVGENFNNFENNGISVEALKVLLYF